MSDRTRECQIYIKRWYTGEPVLTVRMDSDSTGEAIIQALVVELLRDFIDHPIPDGIKEGSEAFHTWVNSGYQKALRGIDFGLTIEQTEAIKNLAWVYWAEGIAKVTADPQLQGRLYKAHRSQQFNG